ncbi:GTPase Era, mitochondrial-like [Oppia nitens]|uniref:GTPase Era, mitochondrial-like n=1 Tax=Oppia nitens TaxID=1686743 RepID=UPI0023DC2BBB|nr:GTPase Era, mitochondrial-like [Oppia nitens]
MIYIFVISLIMYVLNNINNCLKHFMKNQLNSRIVIKKHLINEMFDKNFVYISKCFCHSNKNPMIEAIDETPVYDSNDYIDNKSYDYPIINESLLKTQLDLSERRVAKTNEEYRLLRQLKVKQPPIPRLAKVVMIGSPNAGKSTITNQLVGHRVSAVSSKVHTTRQGVVGVVVEDEIQIELLDTPGIVTRQHCAKHKLETNFINDPIRGVDSADIIAIINDVSNIRERKGLNKGVIKLLKRHPNKESVLILNKIDKIKEKRKLLDITTLLTGGVVGGITSLITKKRVVFNNQKSLETILNKTEEKLNLKTNININTDNENEINSEDIENISWNRFSRVFMTCALTGDGIDDIRQYFLSKAPFHPWRYHRSQVTDQSPRDIIINAIKEKLLDLLPQEIPYKIDSVITMWHLDPTGNMFISLNLFCPKRFQSLVIGPKGQTIASVVQSAKDALQNTFYCDISLKIIVKGVDRK